MKNLQNCAVPVFEGCRRTCGACRGFMLMYRVWASTGTQGKATELHRRRTKHEPVSRHAGREGAFQTQSPALAVRLLATRSRLQTPGGIWGISTFWPGSFTSQNHNGNKHRVNPGPVEQHPGIAIDNSAVLELPPRPAPLRAVNVYRQGLAHPEARLSQKCLFWCCIYPRPCHPAGL